MNFYTLLRLFIEDVVWRSEALKSDALKLVDELEKFNAFGTFTGSIETTVHDHVWEWQADVSSGITTYWQRCRVCAVINQESRTTANPFTRGYYR